jgi:hypothetical protein
LSEFHLPAKPGGTPCNIERNCFFLPSKESMCKRDRSRRPGPVAAPEQHRFGPDRHARSLTDKRLNPLARQPVRHALQSDFSDKQIN